MMMMMRKKVASNHYLHTQKNFENTRQRQTDNIEKSPTEKTFDIKAIAKKFFYVTDAAVHMEC